MPRGVWDRTCSAAARWAAQRTAINRAVAELVTANDSVSVSRVIERAGVGRSTFYAHYRDIPQARRAAEERGETILGRRFNPNATDDPLAGLVRTWIEAARDDPRVRLLLCAVPGRPTRFSRVAARQLVDVVGPLPAPVNAAAVSLVEGVVRDDALLRSPKISDRLTSLVRRVLSPESSPKGARLPEPPADPGPPPPRLPRHLRGD